MQIFWTKCNCNWIMFLQPNTSINIYSRRAYLSMAIVSLWGNMCTMRALRVSRLVSSWVRCTLRVSSPSWRNKIPAFMDGEEQWGRSTKEENGGGGVMKCRFGNEDKERRGKIFISSQFSLNVSTGHRSKRPRGQRASGPCMKWVLMFLISWKAERKTSRTSRKRRFAFLSNRERVCSIYVPFMMNGNRIANICHSKILKW